VYTLDFTGIIRITRYRPAAECPTSVCFRKPETVFDLVGLSKCHMELILTLVLLPSPLRHKGELRKPTVRFKHFTYVPR
jgi:hypothetical protein